MRSGPEGPVPEGSGARKNKASGEAVSSVHRGTLLDQGRR
jgi:hypothetical protein